MHTKCSLFALIYVVYIVRDLECHYLYMQLYSYCIVASYIINYTCTLVAVLLDPILYYTCNYICRCQLHVLSLLFSGLFYTEILHNSLVLVFFAYNKPSKCLLYVCRKGGAMWLQSHLIFHSYRLIMYVQYTKTTQVIAVQHYYDIVSLQYSTGMVWLQCDTLSLRYIRIQLL